MTWEKLPAWCGEIHQGCLLCPPVEAVAPLTMLIGVGFGFCSVTRDGETVWEEDAALDEQELHDLAHFEAMAKADPDHDWRVDLQAPLRGRTYQRHGADRWVLIDSNEGFA